MRYIVIAGGTFVDVAPHFALAAPAFGAIGPPLAAALDLALSQFGRSSHEVTLVLTRMALGGTPRDPGAQALLSEAGLRDLRTNDDMEQLVEHLTRDTDVRGIVLPAALCDFEPDSIEPAYDAPNGFGRASHPRLSSSRAHRLDLRAAAKVASAVRATRKDIFLALFKNTAGDDAPTQYARGLSLLKRHSANLVFANDTRTRLHMVITPEQARYHETTDREAAIRGFAEMIALRTQLRFTRSTVVPGSPVAWSSGEVPKALRDVVDHCVRRGAYKPFLGSTVGHFAARADRGTILTSRRKTDFNDLANVGLVRIEPKGDDSVVAHGGKPSVGGQSQRIIFVEHPDVDCIVHFHCPARPGSPVPVREQRPFECGSHECGENTSRGLASFGRVKAVMLDRHGPNLAFPRSADPAEVIAFIEENFDLTARTDGEVNLAAA